MARQSVQDSAEWETGEIQGTALQLSGPVELLF